MSVIKKIFLDVDDVLADTSNHVLAKYNKMGLFDNPDNCGKRDFHNLIGKSWHECWNLLDQDFWTHIPKMPWCDSLIELCEKYTPGEVYLLTSPIRNGKCSAGKQLWTNKYLSKYSSKLIIGHAKHAVVGVDGLLIDDSYENEEKVVERAKGDNFYLFPSYQNKLWPIVDKLYEDPSTVIRMITNHLESIM